MYYEVDGLDVQTCYKLMASTVMPRPIAFVVTRSVAGHLNAAPYSFFNMLTYDPPLLALGMNFTRPGVPKDTSANIRSTGEFSINLVNADIATQMNIAAIEFPADVSEVDEAKLQTAPSRIIKPPRLAKSPVSFECQRHSVIPVGPAAEVVLGRVVAIHIDDAAILDPVRHYIAGDKLGLIGRMHGNGWYARTDSLFELPRISLDQWGAQSGSDAQLATVRNALK